MWLPDLSVTTTGTCTRIVCVRNSSLPSSSAVWNVVELGKPELGIPDDEVRPPVRTGAAGGRPPPPWVCDQLRAGSNTSKEVSEVRRRKDMHPPRSGNSTPEQRGNVTETRTLSLSR